MTKLKFSVIAAAGVAAAAMSIAAPAAAQAVPGAIIAVVDSERVLRDCNACRTATASLQSQATALQSRNQTLASQLNPERQAIQNAVNALQGKDPDQALQNRIKAFETKAQAAQQEIARGGQNIQSINANVLRQINEKLGPVIQQVMTRRGANIALDQGATLAAASQLDVTSDVLTALNAALPSVSLTPLPAAPAQQTPPKGR